MNHDEALAWIRGERSMTNIIQNADAENGNGSWLVLIAQADAFMTQQAYWVLKAYADNIVRVSV